MLLLSVSSLIDIVMAHFPVKTLEVDSILDKDGIPSTAFKFLTELSQFIFLVLYPFFFSFFPHPMLWIHFGFAIHNLLAKVVPYVWDFKNCLFAWQNAYCLRFKLSHFFRDDILQVPIYVQCSLCFIVLYTLYYHKN